MTARLLRLAATVVEQRTGLKENKGNFPLSNPEHEAAGVSTTRWWDCSILRSHSLVHSLAFVWWSFELSSDVYSQYSLYAILLPPTWLLTRSRKADDLCSM